MITREAQEIAFPSRDRLPFPVPPDELSIQVLGEAASVAAFLYGGFIVAEALREVLTLVGRRLDQFQRVLDFGCGSARILRWFAPESRSCQFLGSDISRAAIEWNRRHIPFGEFHVNEQRPPLDFPDESIDLIYAVSVVTHLDEDLQSAWLKELQRVLRPGGIAILTATTDDIAAWRLSGDDLERYRTKGHLYKRVASEGLHGLPEFYQDAYHSRAYIEGEWSKFFRPLVYVKHGPLYLQDLVVLTKYEAAPDQRRNYAFLDLPFGALGTPMIGDVIAGDQLGVSGWCFHPHGGTEEVDVWLDGRRVASCAADLPTPSVAEVFPAWEVARRCGYSATVKLTGVSEGPHILRISARSNLIACLSGYFFKESRLA